MTRRFSIAVLLVLTLPVLLGSTAGYGQATPDFPSLADQLRNDNVIPGSALERFIRANQDFTLLRPEEAKDKLGLPPWLRVAFRKAHPDGTYSGTDPTGGYPRWLGDVHNWMVTHQDLKPSALPRSHSQAATQILTGPPAVTDPNHRISGAQPGARSESNIRIDPWNSNWIVAASNSLGSNRNQAQFYSTDGGTTWNQTALDFVASDSINGDPSVDWTSDGTAWATTLGIDTSTLNSRLRSYFSFNQGAAWAFDATASATQTAVDKPMLWADHSSTSSFRDRIYAIWDIPGGAAYVNYRTGPSGSWSTPQQVSGSESVGTAIGSDIKVNSFGDVFAFWPATGNQALTLRKSTTGATSFGAATSIAINRGCPSCGTFGSFQIAVPAFITQFHKPLIYVAGAAYRTSTKDLVYASWTDLTGAAGCSQKGDAPGTNVASTCKTRIWFSRSTDGGATWGTPIMVNNQSSLNDQFNQWLAVDDTTGVLGLIYYDTVADAGRLKTDVWYQSSYDDGVTWGSPLKITSAQTDETATGADTDNRYGDYNGLSAYGGVFLPSWTDRRSGSREEIWTASISDSPIKGDFNGDGQTDILWHNTSGAVSVWFMNGTTVASGGSLPSADTSWKIVGTADFNGDGKTDVLWQQTSGAVYVWLMDGTTVVSGVSLPSPDPGWSIVGTGDFNGDGKTDILWHHTSGAVYVWLMNGTTVVSGVSLPSADTSWNIVGTGDFNGDGKTDILWQQTSGAVSVWFMNGTTVVSGAGLPSPDPGWSIAGVGDFNSDGKPDILWRHTSGAVYVWLMNGTTVASGVSLPSADTSWSIVGPK